MTFPSSRELAKTPDRVIPRRADGGRPKIWFRRPRNATRATTRPHRRFNDRALQFSSCLNEWLEAARPADNDRGGVALPSDAAGMPAIEGLIKKLIAIEPDGVHALRMFFVQAMALPQSIDDKNWSCLIVELIDDVVDTCNLVASQAEPMEGAAVPRGIAV